MGSPSGAPQAARIAPGEGLAGDPEAVAIVQEFEERLKGRTTDFQIEILEQILRDIEVGRSSGTGHRTMVEALQVWDLLSPATYTEIQFRLNDEPDGNAVEWESRDLEMIDRVLNAETRPFAAIKHTGRLELAHAMLVTGAATASAVAWCQRVIDQGKSDGSFERMLTAFNGRRARSLTCLEIWHARTTDRIRPETLAQRYDLSLPTVRKFIIAGKTLRARRAILSDPVANWGVADGRADR